MRTPASIAGHPVHPMLVTLPIGLWAFSLISDLIELHTFDSVWGTMAFYTLGAGIIGALLAAVPGVVDMLSEAARPVRKIALTHMALNLIVVALMGVNFWMRYQGVVTMVPLILSAVGILILLVSGWLGGKLVHRYGVGVDTESPEILRLSRRQVYGAH